MSVDHKINFKCAICNGVFESHEYGTHICAVGRQPLVFDTVNHPPHYKAHPSGVECIQITEHMNFCLGNAVKYIWRAGLKNDVIEDLKKAKWYIEREIALRESNAKV